MATYTHCRAMYPLQNAPTHHVALQPTRSWAQAQKQMSDTKAEAEVAEHISNRPRHLRVSGRRLRVSGVYGQMLLDTAGSLEP